MDINNILEIIKNNQLLTAALGLSGAGIVSFWIKDVPRTIYTFLKRHLTTELTITSQNIIFHELLKWIEKQYSNNNFRKVKITNGMWGNQSVATTSIGYDFHWLKYDNTFLLVTLIKDTTNQSTYDKETITILKLGRSHKIFKKIINEIINLEKNKDKIEVYKMDDYWCNIRELKKRSLQSIFLSKNKKDLLIKTLDTFINTEMWYSDHGIPYQLGILLYGPPGTGKTSIIKAIASYLNYPVYYLPTSKLNKIEIASSTLPKNSLLIIEDIDCNFFVQDRNKKTQDKNDNSIDIMEDFASIGLSEILNSLDGMFSAHGRILIATTNHIEKLDSALIRPGRIDLKLEITYINYEILKDFIASFFPDEELTEEIVIKPNITVSILQGYILEGKNRNEILDLIKLN